MNNKAIRHSSTSIFSDIVAGKFHSDEDYFHSLTQAIRPAQFGSELISGETAHDKMRLLALGAQVTFTLTKTRDSGYYEQLRAWVKQPGFWESGGYVDGFQHGAVLEINGSFRDLRYLTDVTLARSKRAFEDTHYVVWI